MLIFKRIAAFLLVAGLAGAALTGVLSAQTGPSNSATGNVNLVENTGSGDSDTQPDPATTAPDAFVAGLDAYRAGNVAAAIAHWEQAADAGHLGAQWNLARVFAGAETRDPRRRVHYLRLLAAQYDPDMPPGPRASVSLEALIELGRIYWLGNPDADVEPQPRRAFSIFEHTATLYGHPRAQHYLGLMYLRGEGVKHDGPRGVRWLFLAARKHYAPSQAALGDYFWQRGTVGGAGPDDRLRGLMWFELASENAKGEELHALFRSRYEAAIAEVSEGEREKVTALVANWNARNVRTLAQAAPQQ